MKTVIIWIIIGVAGYFGYQYFIDYLQKDSQPGPAFNMSSLPERCQRLGEALENAFYQNMKGEIVQTEVAGYTSHFRGCLRREGYTPSQVEEAYNGIAESTGYKNH